MHNLDVLSGWHYVALFMYMCGLQIAVLVVDKNYCQGSACCQRPALAEAGLTTVICAQHHRVVGAVKLLEVMVHIAGHTATATQQDTMLRRCSPNAC